MSKIHENFINGQWSGGREAVTSINPSDLSDPVGRYAQADTSDVDAAIDAARPAQRAWAATGLEQRGAVLGRIGAELMDRSAELGELLSREEGKPRAEGVGEVYRAGQFFQYYAAEVLRQIGDKVDSVRPGIEIDVTREPVGTVAVISPWNFPVATASWKIAPALAFGNAVVWKPANETPAMAWALTEIISRQDIPNGLFNLVMGPGSSIGGHLAGHAGVDAVSFTGSLAVGRRVGAAAAAKLTRFQLEMGSKNALVVMDDADLDTAVQCAVAGAYSGTGQKCTASSRLLVHDAVHDAFVDKLRDAVLAMQVDHALKPGTQVGPVVSERQLAANLEYIALAREEGCEHVCGGERLERATEGYYMAPALFINTRNDMRVNREEMFAPIACVIRVSSYEEALATANDTEYGLTSGIVTGSLARAGHFRRNAEAGCVMVNLPTAGTDYHVPFGGRKNSSFGPREQGRYAAEFYTTVKTAYISHGAGL
ncbi:MAG TPA: aldehyde dehydrogenase family protein [Arenicellales bacterium]|nr:aldehyde dehydrogenase family protein [Arenicellales bacterium]